MQASVASSGREFDASRKYKVVLSERLRNESVPEKYINSIVHISPSLKAPSRVKSAQIKTAPDDADDVSLHLTGPRPGDTYIYGGEHSATRTLVLLFDQAAQTFTLDAVDAEYSFANEEAAPSDGSASASESDGSPPPRAAAAGDGADPDNPYDWRNHLHDRSKSSSSPDPDLHLGAPAVAASPSPEPPQRRRPVDPPAAAAKRPEPARAKPKPRPKPAAAAPAARPKPAPRPAQRRPSTPPSDSPREIDLGGGRAAASERPSPSREPVRMELDGGGDPGLDESEDDDGGGLEIVEDGANEPRRGRGRFAHRRVLAGLGEGPRSLRASRSPVARPESGFLGQRGRGGGAESDDDSGDDRDVEAMQLGSPMHEEPNGQAAQADEDEEMEDADNLEAEFERALEEGEDKAAQAAPVSRYVEESSSESEEE